MEDRSLSWQEHGDIDEATRLRVWRDRLARANADYSEEVERIRERESLYKGRRRIEPLVQGDAKKDGSAKKASHVNNIVFENIESMISTNIPTPKVTAKHKEDEKLAMVIEHWLRNELDRMPFEMNNDMAERTVPIQGGTGWQVEWDTSKRTHRTAGEVKVSLLHPKLFAPQPGVFTGIQDMDWFIVKCPTTKGSIKREYKIDIFNLSEEEPEIRSNGGTKSQDEMVTKYIGYEKNEDGGIDRFVWVNDVVLENIENYQARHQQVCRSCKRRRPSKGQIISNNVEGFGELLPRPGSFDVGILPDDLLERTEGAFGVAGSLAGREEEILAGLTEPGQELLEGIEINAGKPKEPVKYDGGPCPYCGSRDWTDAESEYEEVFIPIKTDMGTEIKGADYGLDEDGKPVLKPVLIPYYKPDVIPIVLQRNVSVYGQLLGNSDVDAIKDHQNTTNRLHQKINDRVMKAGTRITLPPDPSIRMDTEDNEVIRLSSPDQKSYIGTYNFTGNIESEIAFTNLVYEEARRTLGITNSFQGREDRTAQSGVAKQTQVAQSAGRLQSKRVMKAAAYAELFEMMFKFQLAYSDEPRSVSYRDHNGNKVYETFDRYDFLKQDADGVYYWNDDFLFSVDSNDALENNRAAMWQETRMNLESGAFGPREDISTLILFWSKMEQLHYPGAGETRKYLEEKMEKLQAAAQAKAAAEAAAQAAAQGGMPTGGIPAEAGGLPQAAPAGPVQEATAGAGL